MKRSEIIEENENNKINEMAKIMKAEEEKQRKRKRKQCSIQKISGETIAAARRHRAEKNGTYMCLSSREIMK